MPNKFNKNIFFNIMSISVITAASLLSSASSAASPNKPLKMVFVGDVMLGSNYPTPILPNNLSEPLAAAAPWLTSADFAFGNLEGAITDVKNSGKNCSKCYSFRMPVTTANVLREAGFDVMSIANNHANDFGPEGLRDSHKNLLSVGILSTGPIGVEPAVVVKNGIKIGVLAYATNRGMRDPRDLQTLSSDVKKLKNNVDVLIVSFHAGAEGAAAETTPHGTEFYLSENRGNVRAIARTAIDAGADLVVGHGPHVPRSLDMYKGKLIAYSLGNFATYGRFNLSGSMALAPFLWVELDQGNKIRCVRVGSAAQKKPGIAYIDPDERALDKMKRLTYAENKDAWPHINNLLNSKCHGQ